MDKAKIQQVINGQPEEVDVDVLVERLYLLEKIDIAEKEIAAGKGIPHEEVKQRLGKWLE